MVAVLNRVVSAHEPSALFLLPGSLCELLQIVCRNYLLKSSSNAVFLLIVLCAFGLGM